MMCQCKLIEYPSVPLWGVLIAGGSTGPVWELFVLSAQLFNFAMILKLL